MKHFNWTKKPVTWGAYAVICVIAVCLSGIITVAGITAHYWESISEFFIEKYAMIEQKIKK